ncbi:Zinc finger, Rad18-type putative [Ceratobasidium sp. AG-Ba]|nr:Zinc finger, Rad18-type putative [Ceratobasidium sp. AG-Ba]
MDHYSYVDAVNSNLVCCICRNPFVEPTTSSTCGHTFCRACIAHALEVSPYCPIDRSQLGPTDLHLASAVGKCPLDRFFLPADSSHMHSSVRNMVDELIVECPHAPLGCTHTTQRHLIDAHFAGCTYAPVPCPTEGCTSSVLSRDAEADEPCPKHLSPCSECDSLAPTSDVHTAHCPARLVPCPHCSELTPYSALSTHESESCLSAPVSCSLSHVGCAWTGPRSSLSDHPKSCAYEPLRAFFTTHQTRVTELERTVSALRSELDATKRSLGPWFRPANAPASSEPEPPRLEFRPLVGRRRVSSPLHTSMFHFDEPGTNAQHSSLAGRRRAGSGSRLVISTTNPPPAEDVETSTLDPFAHPLPSPTDSQQPRLEAVPYIPPLNTQTSLEHTLSMLRNSLVGMAASLDMSERRQEMVVTTESLRMHEEVGAIRAIVHGLRMQVSALVMERNVQMMGRLTASTRPNASENTGGTRTTERGDGERWATETRYYNQPPPQPVNLAVPYSIRRQETNNKL